MARAHGARAAVVLALAAGCSERRVYDRFDGASYTERRPRLARPDGGAAALVSDYGDDTIALLDLRRPTLIGRYPVGIDPVARDGPHHIAIDNDARVVFTAFDYVSAENAHNPHGSHGTAIVPGVLARLALDDLRVLDLVDTDAKPGDVAVTPDGRHVLVSHYDLQRADQTPGDGGESDPRHAALIVYDATTLRERGRVHPGIATHGIAITPDSRYALVACYGSDTLAVVDLEDLSVRVYPVGPNAGTTPTLAYGPYAVTLSPDGATAYVSTFITRDVRRFDMATRTMDTTNSAGVLGSALFAAIGPAGRTLVVPTQAPDGIALVDRESMRRLAFRPLSRAECQQPHQVAESPEGRYYVVCEGDTVRRLPGAVLEIDPHMYEDPAMTLRTLGRAEVGVFPDAIVFVRGAAR